MFLSSVVKLRPHSHWSVYKLSATKSGLLWRGSYMMWSIAEDLFLSSTDKNKKEPLRLMGLTDLQQRLKAINKVRTPKRKIPAERLICCYFCFSSCLHTALPL